MKIRWAKYLQKPIDFEMLYFQEFPDYIAIVCEGNKTKKINMVEIDSISS